MAPFLSQQQHIPLAWSPVRSPLAPAAAPHTTLHATKELTTPGCFSSPTGLGRCLGSGPCFLRPLPTEAAGAASSKASAGTPLHWPSGLRCSLQPGPTMPVASQPPGSSHHQLWASSCSCLVESCRLHSTSHQLELPGRTLPAESCSWAALQSGDNGVVWCWIRPWW